MIDCLIVGFNDSNFAAYVQTVKALGVDSGAYRDLSLAFLEYEGRHYRALDILTHLHPNDDVYFANTDFLWPTITYLGSYLSKHGFSFDYINEFQRDTELFREKLQQNDILTIAITTTLYVLPDPILEVVNFIRQYNKTVKIIVGGPYICNQFESLSELEFQSLFHYLSADIYVNNREGEATLVDILSALKHGDDLSEVKNISYKIGDEYKITHSEVESNDLEDNMVNYTLFPKRDIGQFVSLRTAKSCPFSCAFCGFPARAGKYVYTSVDHVEKELNALKELGTVTTLTFLDDTFNVPKKRFADILQMMIRNQYEFKWNSFFRSDHGDESIIELMKEAGCEGVFLGTESGSNTILEKMNKTARREHYMKTIPWFRKYGITTYASMIVGFPGETFETYQETIDLIEETQPDFYRGQLWFCDPLTPIWEKREEYGVTGSGFAWSHKTMDSETACDLIDQMFLSIQNSIWMPQWGFELWSIYYLQRKGMSLEQIKKFVRDFNAVIAEQLLYPNKKDISPKLVDNLKQSCQFDLKMLS